MVQPFLVILFQIFLHLVIHYIVIIEFDHRSQISNVKCFDNIAYDVSTRLNILRQCALVSVVLFQN
jgi:hypothetical protein